MKYKFTVTFEKQLDNIEKLLFETKLKKLFETKLKKFLEAEQLKILSEQKSEVIDFLDTFFGVFAFFNEENGIRSFKNSLYEDYTILENLINEYNIDCKLVEKIIPDYDGDGSREVVYIYNFQLFNETKYIKFMSYEESWGELSFYTPVFVTPKTKTITVYE